MRVLLLTAGLVLSACGQKGPLYLPDQGSTVVVRPAPDSTTQDNEKKKARQGEP